MTEGDGGITAAGSVLAGLVNVGDVVGVQLNDL
jgi:hypothetical protein